MHELVRVELPPPLLSSAVCRSRGVSGRGVVRTKSGNIINAPTPSSQTPSLSSSVTQNATSADLFGSDEMQRTLSPQFSTHSSLETVLMASSCDSVASESQTSQQPQSMQMPNESMTMQHVLIPTYGLHLDLPNQVIKEVSDLEESNGAAYDSDDSLKDLNWLGGLSKQKHSTESRLLPPPPIPAQTSLQKAKQLQSPRRNQLTVPNPSAVLSASATSPRNRSALLMPYVKRLCQAPAAGTVLSPIRQSSPIQPELNQLQQLPQLPSPAIQPAPASLMSSSVPVSQMINPPWVIQQREQRRLNRLKRPPFSYIALCCMALASSETLTLPLTQIYKWIEDSFPYYSRPECYQDWRSSIRHTLSLYSFFQSAPVVIGRKTIPTWRLDVTESERLEIARLVGEYQGHMNSQFISEWTSRLVYAEQRSHRRGAYDRQASRFKAFSALRSRSSSTDTLTSTHSTSTSATGGYQSFTPDSGMSSITSTNGPTPLTISEADISLLSGALTSITAATVAQSVPVASASSSIFHHRRMSPATTVISSSPAPSSVASSQPSSTTTYETGPGITIIRIPPNAPKFGLLVLAPSPAQYLPQQQTLTPATPMSVTSDSNCSSAPLYDLTNQGFGLQIQNPYQQNGQSPAAMSAVSSATPPGSVVYQHQQPQQHYSYDQTSNNQMHMQFMAEYHSQLIATGSPSQQHQQGQQQQFMAYEVVPETQHEEFQQAPQIEQPQDLLADLGSSMDFDMSLQDLVGAADDLFADTDGANIDFGGMLDGALDTPRSVLLPLHHHLNPHHLP